jgi:hypothetical protein
MRVTKTIREYIENQVQKKYEERIAAVSKKYNSERKAIDDKCKEFVKEANEKMRDFISENYPNWIKDGANTTLIRHYEIYNEKATMSIRSEKDILNREIKNHITEIILTLELGGSKQELQDMLNKIN